MIQPSKKYLAKLTDSLFEDTGQRELFLNSFAEKRSPSGANKALLWRENPETPPHPGPNWIPPFVSLISGESNPGRSEQHARGDFYIMDPSSIFEGMVISAIPAVPHAPKIILDTCASPGGKSIFAARMFKPELLISNEVIRKRCPQLVSNLDRLKLCPGVVTSNEVSILAEELKASADLVIVDAPCSGQSLVLKNIENPGGFNPRMIEHNSLRQRKIIANSAHTVAGGGYLAYMTCTFSKEENEELIEWFLKKFPDFKSVECQALSAHRSHLTENFCYRLWPFDGYGAGGFTALFRKQGEEKNDCSLDNLYLYRDLRLEN